MKKIFSLFAALMLVLSVNAAPFAAKKVAKQTVSARLAVGAVELAKLNRNEARATKVALQHQAKSVNVQAPARTQDVTLTFDDCWAWSYDSYYEDGSWDLDLYDGEDHIGFLSIMGDCDATHICGSYDIEDAIDGYPGAIFYIDGDTIYAVSGFFEITYVSSAEGVPTYNVSGSLICSNGETIVLDNDFTVSYAIDYYSYSMWYYYGMGEIEFIELDDAPFEPTGETVDVVVPGVSMLTDATAKEGWFEIAGENDEYYVILDFIADQVVGTYGPDDFDYDYTAVYDANDKRIAAKYDDANVAEVYTSGDTTVVEAVFMAKDGNYYNVVMKYYIPTPTEEIDVVLEGEVDDETYAAYGVIDYEIENDDYILSLLLYFNGPGTYTLDDVVGMNSTQGSYLGDYNTMYIVNILDATFVIAADYSMTATLISADARQFNIFYNQPTAVENVEAGMKAVKTVKNGQLVIIKNGVEYNAQGAKL